MKYRLIALDIDGTLLNDRDELTEPTRRAVLEAYSMGARIVLCTGRGPYNAVPVMKELGLEGAVITHNGAATVESADYSLAHQFTFELADALPIIEHSRKLGLHCDICSAFELYVDRAGDKERDMYRRFGITPVFVPDIARLDIAPVKLTLFGDPALIDEVERDWASLRFPLAMIRSADEFIDVMHPDASKGSALRVLAERLGIGREQIMAIGNYYNDIAMLRYAGLGIAMDNAPEGVKRAADAVTVSNNEDGVSLALRRYAFGERMSL